MTKEQQIKGKTELENKAKGGWQYGDRRRAKIW